MADSTLEPAELAARLFELESRLEFQDQTITKLNDELFVHQQKMTEMNKKMALILERLPATDQLQHNPADEPPPPHF